MSKLNAWVGEVDNSVTALQQQGAQVFLVGGAVRDALLGRPVTERDWVVVGSNLNAMTALGFRQVGKDFPVFLHPHTHEEYALARTERKTGSGYKGFSCDASEQVTLEQDLLRRDLTINAMAVDMRGELIDPYQGKHDLDQGVLRHVSDAFREDPLRLFRVARFAARYHTRGFTVAPSTLVLMQQMSNPQEIGAIAAERIWQETAKAVMESSPHVFFDVLFQSGALQCWCPPWTERLETRLAILCESAQANSSLEQRIACLCADMKGADAASLLAGMRAPSSVQHIALLASEVYHRLLSTGTLETATLLELYQRCDLWRRPHQWQAIVPVILYWLRHTAPTHWFIHGYAAHDEDIVRAVASLSVQPFIQQGLSGSALGMALHSAREAVIHDMLKNNSTSIRD